MIRNFIDVVGITPESELPNKISGQIIQYTETETIFITEGRHKIKNISQIKFEINIKSRRIIDAPLGKVVVLDGVKNFKIRYCDKDNSRRETLIELETPYNTFFELPKEVEKYKDVKVYIMDAYFQLFEGNKLYSHVLYLVNPLYENIKNNSKTTTDSNNSKNPAKLMNDYNELKTYNINNIDFSGN